MVVQYKHISARHFITLSKRAKKAYGSLLPRSGKKENAIEGYLVSVYIVVVVRVVRHRLSYAYGLTERPGNGVILINIYTSSRTLAHTHECENASDVITFL